MKKNEYRWSELIGKIVSFIRYLSSFFINRNRNNKQKELEKFGKTQTKVQEQFEKIDLKKENKNKENKDLSSIKNNLNSRFS